MKDEKIREATKEWVKEFNSFPIGMIEKLFTLNADDWHELTPIKKESEVWSYEYQELGRVTEMLEDNLIKIELSNGEEVVVEKEEVFIEENKYFPMWGYMWQFSDSCDDWWLESHLQEMADCGFRIYESDEFGYFFGIDGAGYDFYEAHWIPLYKVRELQWHKYR